jgi:D-alanyl-D-alanine carboxypeptidase
MKVSKDEEGEKSTSFLANLGLKRKSHLKLFIHHMNKLCRFLHLNSTHFANTHGLMNEKAFSCSQNISLLTYYSMCNPIFREIVAKQTFKCKIHNRTFSHSKEVLWENTNKLLTIEGFIGVKTGITPSAGPCLTSYFQISPSEYFIVTILKTKSCEMRFK